jgi:hypothetical protein
LLFLAYRLTREYRERALLEVRYAEKERARMEKQWKERTMWKTPKPFIPVMGFKNV